MISGAWNLLGAAEPQAQSQLARVLLTVTLNTTVPRAPHTAHGYATVPLLTVTSSESAASVLATPLSVTLLAR